MHVVHKNKTLGSLGYVFLKHGNDFFVDCFLLCVADWVLAAIGFFAVFVETECTRGDVET